MGRRRSLSLRRDPCDLVLLDVMMPKMSGFEVCERIRERFSPAELPVILLTAKNRVSDLVNGFSAGANDYLTKPFASDELLARVNVHLELAKISDSYARFVPRQFLEQLGKERIIDVALGDQVQREMTVLFSDIRDFTRLPEGMTPAERSASSISILARWSLPSRPQRGDRQVCRRRSHGAVSPPGRRRRARRAGDVPAPGGMELERAARGEPPVQIGIGLHTGSLMLGTSVHVTGWIRPSSPTRSISHPVSRTLLRLIVCR